MSKVLVVNSFRHSTGKSTLVANLAGILAQKGQRVAVIDTCFETPSLQTFLGLSESDIQFTLNDYLWGHCAFEQMVYDATPGLEKPVSGQILLLPASSRLQDMLQQSPKPLDFERLSETIQNLENIYQPDVILFDTAAGLQEETLISIALAHTLVVLLRPEQQDYQGTAVTLEVARQLEIPRLCLVLNDAPTALEPHTARSQLHQSFDCEVAGLLPHTEELVLLASSRLLTIEAPEDPFVDLLDSLANFLVSH